MLPQTSNFFNSFSLLELAFNNKFIINHSYKIDPLDFVMSFFDMMNQDCFTWDGWAKRFFISTNTLCSANGLTAKFGFRYIFFFKALLKKALVYSQTQLSNPPPIAFKFNHIWVTDSTCLSMPESLHGIFPGANNQFGSYSTARIQLTMDLLTDQIHKLDICSFRNNDQSYSSDVLGYVKKGDLVIRDLGYFAIDVFKALEKKEAKFISKLRYGMVIRDNQGLRMNLLKKLKLAFNSGVSHVDWHILMSNKKIPVRLIAVKCDSKVASQKVRKAENDRQPKVNHGPEYMEMQGYHILITNIEKDEIDLKDIWELYRLRWRIEVVFKCWKSKLNLEKLFKNKTMKNYSVPYCMLYLALTKIVICHNSMFVPLRNKIRNKKGIPNLSMLKYYDIMANEFHLISGRSSHFISKFLAAFSIYKRDINRKTHLEMLYMLNSS